MSDRRRELVRVDPGGTAHPIGVGASQRLRAGVGTYRMLPSPPNHVWLRQTDVDGGSETGPVVRLAGQIVAPGAVCDILGLLAQTGWRGEFMVLSEEGRRSIFFEQGFILGATTTVEEERLGQVLYRYGAVSVPQLEYLMEAVQQGRRLGDVTVEEGLVTREKLFEFLHRQVEEVLFATFSVAEGMFYFVDDFDVNRLVARLAMNANSLLMDGITRLDEMAYFQERVPSVEHVAMRSSSTVTPPAELKEFCELVDGRRNVEELGRLAGLGEFQTIKNLFQLVQHGCVTILPPRVEGGPEGLAETANQALRQIHAVVDQAGQGAMLRSNLASFTVGAGVYDILFLGAGPRPDGSFDAERVVANADVVAAGAEPESFLTQLMHEYLSFALFSAGAALGQQRGAELDLELGPLLDRLRPRG